nr:MAG TPA: hypothetical protein [Caudoviricetes sp.]
MPPQQSIRRGKNTLKEWLIILYNITTINYLLI